MVLPLPAAVAAAAIAQHQCRLPHDQPAMLAALYVPATVSKQACWRGLGLRRPHSGSPQYHHCPRSVQTPRAAPWRLQRCHGSGKAKPVLQHRQPAPQAMLPLERKLCCRAHRPRGFRGVGPQSSRNQPRLQLSHGEEVAPPPVTMAARTPHRPCRLQSEHVRSRGSVPLRMRGQEQEAQGPPRRAGGHSRPVAILEIPGP
mmetsp:Transcript_6268/g.15411  ORF Transcript_6268/g.15411 Transcript_6268/m.15411 type:complete len:201 (+) Transcript_6268:223-825(+)